MILKKCMEGKINVWGEKEMCGLSVHIFKAN